MSDFGALVAELETVAIAKAEQRYLDPVRNVVPLTGQDIEILKADLGYTRCAVCRLWFGPLEEQCPRCEIPCHRRDGW
jgi:uncharacterized paraquat-inducible protein A